MRTSLRKLIFANIVALLAVSSAACDSADHPNLLAPQAPTNTRLLPPPIQPVLPIVCAQSVICSMNWNVDISAGDAVTCSVRMNGAAYCWGDNADRMLGIGGTSSPETCGIGRAARGCSTKPVAVAGGHQYSSISVGDTHVCAIEKGTSAAYCWGANDAGQLGAGVSSGTMPSTSTPTLVVGGYAFTTISAGVGVTCGVTTSSAAVCWGGTLGSSPTTVSDLPGSFVRVSVGNAQRCGLNTSANTCLGSSSPYTVLSQGSTASHFCEIGGNGTECWGQNDLGQLGSPGTRSFPAHPVAVSGGFTFQSVATGAFNTCALSGADAYCWGGNQYMQVGTTEVTATYFTPQQVVKPSANPQFTKISVGQGHVCALDNSGGVWCWGRDDLGQVGTGGTLTGGFPPGVAQPTHILQ